MFSFGLSEIVLLFILVLIIVGPEQIPNLAKNIAKIMHYFRSIKDDVQNTIDQSIKTESQNTKPTLPSNASKKE